MWTVCQVQDSGFPFKRWVSHSAVRIQKTSPGHHCTHTFDPLLSWNPLPLQGVKTNKTSPASWQIPHRVLMCGVSHPPPLAELPSLSACQVFVLAMLEPQKLHVNRPCLPSEGEDGKHFFCLPRIITSPSHKELIMACFLPQQGSLRLHQPGCCDNFLLSKRMGALITSSGFFWNQSLREGEWF